MSVTFVSNDYDNYCGNTKNIGLISSSRGERSLKFNSLNNKNKVDVPIN